MQCDPETPPDDVALPAFPFTPAQRAASLTDTATSLLVVAALAGSALCGAAVRARAPATLISGEAGEILRRVISLIAVLAALMLSMGIASLKSTFDNADRDVQRLGAQIEQLDRTLRRIGPPAGEARQALSRLTAALVRDTSPELNATFRGKPRITNDLQDELDQSLERLGNGPTAPWLVVQAQSVLHDVVRTRWSMEELTGPTVSGWQLGVLLFWLMLVFAGLGLFAPRNALVVTALLLCAVALGFAFFLLTELDNPFTGVITISREPLLHALQAQTES